MKKIAVLILISVCLLGLCSCGGSAGPGRPLAPESEPISAPGGRVEDIYYTAPKLTVEALKWLVELRGEDLGWNDFMLYECKDIGSGLCIRKYPIDDTLCLVITGGSPDIPPAYIRLAAVDGDGFTTDNSIDPRTEDIDGFLSEIGK